MLEYVLVRRVAIMSPALNFVLSHLWQSTAFAAALALLTLAFRRNQARTRYSIWLAASLKFLVPFSVLTGIGRHLGWRTASRISQSGLSLVIDEMNHPFEHVALTGVTPEAAHAALSVMVAVLGCVWLSGCAGVLMFWWRRWIRLSRIVGASERLTGGRELSALRRRGAAAGIRGRIDVVSSPLSPEPGVLGILRPVLVLPAGISGRLSDEQFEAVLTHELCHIRRRDNLTAAIHMIVEAIFWFHPLVWWLGARMVEERERACDEEVLRSGNEPETYAEGILRICEYYLESPLLCVAGVTGSNLKRRIEEIMNHQAAMKLGAFKKLLLASAGIAAVAGPIFLGVLNAPQGRAQSQTGGDGKAAFEVASIKPGQPGDHRVQLMIAPGGRINAKNVTVKILMQQAYGIKDFQIVGGPNWLGSEAYDIVAKAESGEEVTPDRFKLMLQSLLADRYKLAFHRETKEMPVYSLVIGKNGPKLKEAEGGERGSMIRMGRGQITGKKMSMAMLARELGQQLGRSVLDKTGLTKDYDVTLEWTPDAGERMGQRDGGPEGAPAAAADTPGPSIFTALQEQLGLKLESQRGPVEILIIDRIEKPTEN